jgi:hypothetical protein
MKGRLILGSVALGIALARLSVEPVDTARPSRN